MTTKVLSVGGSIIAPDKPDENFLFEFSSMICSWLSENKDARLILVAGGGGPARNYQNSYKAVSEKFDENQKKLSAFEDSEKLNYACDWIGIVATRLNAQLLKTVFGPLCSQDVVTDPTKVSDFTGRILIASG